LLQTRQDEVKIDDLSIPEILKDFKAKALDHPPIKQTKIEHEELRYSNLKDFDENYEKKQLNKDILATFSAFNHDKDIPMYITKIDKEDTSTPLLKKYTYTVKYQDALNTKHSITIDFPKLYDSIFIQINGSKKMIQKQILLYPIVKTKPDTVQLTTSYNKFFITRFGSKLSAKTEKFKKFFAKDASQFILGSKFKYKLGNTLLINSKFNTSLEYDEFASYLITLDMGPVHFLFNQNTMDDLLNNDLNKNATLSKIKYNKDEYFPVGYIHQKDYILILSNYTSDGIFYAEKSGKIYKKSLNLSTYIESLFFETLPESAYTLLSKYSEPKTLTYTRLKINNKIVPLIIILGYEIGLKNVLEKYKVKYIFEESSRKSSKENMTAIKFKNGYLYFNNSAIKDTLLLEGLTVLSTSEYNFDELDSKDPYIDLFLEMFGSRNTGKGFHNTITLMIDPITKDVLEELKLPTDIIDILLYCNTLLTDSTYKELNDMSVHRIRSTEQINAYLYKILADAFKTYKDTLKSGNPIKMSVPKDILIKKVMESQTTDEYSALNPSLYIEKRASSTYKGIGGSNLDNAFTQEIRSFNKNMAGIFAMSSPDSNKVGVVRQLSFNSKITNTRGFLDVNKETTNQSTNIYGAAELISPFTTTLADPPRKYAIHIGNYMSKLS